MTSSQLKVLKSFRTVSGLKPNNKEIEVLLIGTNTGRDEMLWKKVEWIKNKVKALGVWSLTEPKVSMEANYSDKLSNVNQCWGSREFRSVSLPGRITVLKIIEASKLVYTVPTIQATSQQRLQTKVCRKMVASFTEKSWYRVVKKGCKY